MLEKRLENYKKMNPNELTNSQFGKIEKEMKSEKGKLISDELFDFQLWCKGYPSRQQQFADYASKEMKKKQAKKVLEVGCGRTAILSRILTKKGFKVTCIDPNLDIVSLKDTNIKGISNKLFSYHYDISEFDYVVAVEPCDATAHIVKACEEQNKPLIMSLCGKPHKAIDGTSFTQMEDWIRYLIKLSNHKARLRIVDLNALISTPLLQKD